MSIIIKAIRFTLLIFLLGGILYPLVMTGLGQCFFPNQANGSLIKRPNGQIIGSRLIGQSFSKAEYFHPRPAVNAYDASNSGGSNLGATSKKLMDRISQVADAYRTENLLARRLPVDAVTASASSLDPHISLANAILQIPRVARSRGLSQESVQVLVTKFSERPPLSEAPYVNVLVLNLALEQQVR